MPDDPLQKLRDAGVNVDKLSDEQRKALSGLTSEEVETLRIIRGKLNPAGSSKARSEGEGEGENGVGVLYY